jgi:hypothetical protein
MEKNEHEIEDKIDMNLQPEAKEEDKEVPNPKPIEIKKITDIELKKELTTQPSQPLNPNPKTIWDAQGYFKDLTLDFLNQYRVLVELVKTEGVPNKYAELFVTVFQNIQDALKR